MRADDGAEVDDAAVLGAGPLDRLPHGENRPEDVDAVVVVNALFRNLREGTEVE